MIEIVRAIIENEEGDLLLGLRVEEVGGGKWALLGGKCEDDIPPIAIEREIREEAGVDFINNGLCFVGIDQDPESERVWKVYYFFGVVTGDFKIDRSEHEEIRYWRREDLVRLDFAFGHRERLQEYFEFKLA